MSCGASLSICLTIPGRLARTISRVSTADRCQSQALQRWLRSSQDKLTVIDGDGERQRLRAIAHDVRTPRRHVPPGHHAEEIDPRELLLHDGPQARVVTMAVVNASI